MKLSMMTYTMARQGYSVQEILKTAEKLEMDGIDWVTTYGHDPGELRKMSLDAGLDVVCHTFFASRLMSGESEWLDEIEQSIDDAVSLGAPVVMIPTGVNEMLSRDEFRRFWIEALGQIVPLAEQAGIVLTIENYPGEHSAFVTADDYFEAKNQIPQLRLTYDNGNAASGEDPIESLNLCKDEIVHVHFKDWSIRNHPAEGYRRMLDGRFFRPALVGQGDVPTCECLEALRRCGYDGYINIEYEGDDIAANEAVRLAVVCLRQHIDSDSNPGGRHS